jgi:integrase
VSLSRLLDLLDGQTSRKDRIVSIKHLYSWLRQTDRIVAADDPTLDALPVPQAKKSQDVRGSKVIPESDYRAVLPHLSAAVADACRVMAATGCHLSEVIRLIKSGTVEDGEKHGLADGDVLGFLHKGGHVHRVATHTSVGDAVRRLKASGWAPARETFYREIREACVKAGVVPWTPGRFRHTFATRAVAGGVDPAAVALALGHTSPATTLSWYATTAVAPRVDGGYGE